MQWGEVRGCQDLSLCIYGNSTPKPTVKSVPILCTLLGPRKAFQPCLRPYLTVFILLKRAPSRISKMSSIASNVLEAEPRTTNGASAVTCKKRDLAYIYLSDTPLPYIEFLHPKRYGVLQDRLSEFLAPTRKALLAATPTPRVFEIGALYGNATLALTNGMNWEQTCAFWKGSQKLDTEFRVSAFDLSKPALLYGMKMGIYENIFIGDMNEPFEPKAHECLVKANVLSCVMTLYYMADGRWEEICEEFLKDRSQEKYIIFSNACAFDSRDCSPHKLFRDVKGWTFKQTFCLHREFFPEEVAEHNGCKESWAWFYVVTFEKI